MFGFFKRKKEIFILGEDSTCEKDTEAHNESAINEEHDNLVRDLIEKNMSLMMALHSISVSASPNANGSVRRLVKMAHDELLKWDAVETGAFSVGDDEEESE